MQYNQLLCANALPNYGPYYNCNPPLQPNGYPEIIGEGNVVSMVSPDGSVQLLFMPNVQWMGANGFNSNFGNMNCNNPYWNNSGAWFVRGVPGLSPPAPFNPQYNSSRQYFNSDNKMSTCGFQVKFHNDSWTSTTDLHYFYPSLRQCDWFPKPKGYAAVQVKEPSVTNTVCHYEVVCNKPCHCAADCCEAKTSKRSCNKLKISHSSMSIEENKPNTETNCSGTNTEAHKCGASHKNTKSNTTSQCEEVPPERIGLDKSVTTYTDQSSNCVADNGRETQTIKNADPIRKTKSVIVQSNDARTELWFPKTSKSKKAMAIKSSGIIIGSCESSCRSGNCSCSSDTDRYEDM